MQGKVSESSNVRTMRVITICVSGVIHSFLHAYLKSFVQFGHQTYGLDCEHHLSDSNLAGDSLKPNCKDSNFQLTSDRRHLEMAKNMIRGGTASVFHSCFFKAKTKKAPTSIKINLAPWYD